MNPEKVIALDIETGPLPLDRLKYMMPEFTAPSNYKDPDKIQRSIWDQQEKWIERAALSPISGQLLAYGYKHPRNGVVIYTQDTDTNYTEKDLLNQLWQDYVNFTLDGFCFAGSNLVGFDFQFLKIRSHILQVELPPSITWARYGSEAGVFDLQDWWNFCPGQNRDKTGLDAMAKALGFAGKNGDGALFYKTFAENRGAAIEYLENDIVMTSNVIKAICPKTKPRIDI